jgi:hypothetical protein
VASGNSVGFVSQTIGKRIAIPDAALNGVHERSPGGKPMDEFALFFGWRLT